MKNETQHVKKSIGGESVLSAEAHSKSSFVLEVLRYEFSKRAKKNPGYSLRAFAKHLNVSHTLLSLFLNGHRNISSKMVEKIAERLQYSPDKIAKMLESLSDGASVKKKSKNKYEVAAASYKKISLDQFSLISEWQHYAILSLLEISDTELTPEFIAKRLNISPLMAKLSIQRLMKFELIERTDDGRYRQSSGPIVVENTTSTVWTRKFQQQLISKAVESLQNDPIELRDFSSTTFAMDSQHIPYAVKRIREFRRGLTRELEAFGSPQEVYNLTVQIFPTSKRNKL